MSLMGSAPRRAVGRERRLGFFASASLGVLALAMASSASAQTTISVGGGTVTTTQTDTYSNYSGAGGPLILTPNSTGNNDLVAFDGVTLTNTSGSPNPYAVDMGLSTNVTGSYTVTLQGSSLTAQSGAGALFAESQSGTVTLDTTGGAANTISGGAGYSVSGSSLGLVNVVARLGSDTVNTTGTAVQLNSTGGGNVSFDMKGAQLTSTGAFGQYGVYVGFTNGAATLGASNGGLSGTISVSQGYGIYVSGASNTYLALGSNGSITGKGGIYLGNSDQSTVDSYGTITASSLPAITGNGNETITLESGSKTVGIIQGGQSTGSVNLFNIVAGADVTGATFQGRADGTNTIDLMGSGTATFDVGTTSSINTIEKDGTGTWNLSNSGSPSGISYVVNAGELTISSDGDLGTGASLALKDGSRLGFRAGGSFSQAANVAGSTAFDTMGHVVTYSGTIGDGTAPGAVTVTGGGTLVLTNTGNSYSGGTSVAGGSTLQIADDRELGEASGGLTFGDATTSGTLQLVGALSTTRTVTLNAGGGTIDTNGFDMAVSQPVAGAGGLTKAGAGTLTLPGDNTYAGGTTINNGTLQLGTGGTSGSVVGPVTDNYGTLVVDRSGSYVFANQVAGGGGSVVRFTGGGTVTVPVSSSYNPVTTIIDPGTTLQFGDGTGDTSTANSIIDNGTLIYNSAGGLVGTAISGSGSVIKEGPGTLQFFPLIATSYTGGTSILSGTLQVFSDTDLGDPSGALTVANGATFQPQVFLTVFPRPNPTTFTSARNIMLGAGGGTIGGGTDAPDVIALSGQISGVGGLTEIGSSTLVLSGINTYTGPTTISSGTLALSGSGSIASSSGVIDNGTFDISGTTSGATIQSLSGTGAVVLGSETLTISGGSTAFSGSMNGSGALAYTGGGTITLNGTNVISGGVTIAGGSLVIGDQNHTSASLTGNVTIGSGATLSGHGTILGAVNNAGGIVAPGGSIGTLTVSGYTQGANGTLQAEVSPSAASSLQVTGAASLNGTFNADFDPGTYSPHVYSILTANSIAGSFASFTTSGAATGLIPVLAYGGQEVDLVLFSPSAGQLYGDNVTDRFDTAISLNELTLDHAASCDAAGKCAHWSLWLDGLGGASHMDPGNGAAAFGSHLWGFIGGADYGFDTGVSLHAAFSYSQSHLSVSGGGAHLATDGLYAALAVHLPWIVQVDGDGFVMQNSASASRDAGFTGNAASHPDSTAIGFALQAGLPLANGIFVPQARLAYTNLHRVPIVENGGGALALAVAGGNSDAVRGDFGARLRPEYSWNGLMLQPELGAYWEQDFGSLSRGLIMNPVGTTTLFNTLAPTPDRTAARFEARLRARMSGAWELHIGTQARFSSHQDEEIFDAGVRWRF